MQSTGCVNLCIPRRLCTVPEEEEELCPGRICLKCRIIALGCVYRRDSPSNRRFKSPISLPVTLDKRDGDLITCLAYRTRVPQNSGIWLPLSQMRDSSSGDKHNMIWFAYVCMNSGVRFVWRIEATGLSWFWVPSINTARMRSCICERDRIADSVRDSSTHF